MNSENGECEIVTLNGDSCDPREASEMVVSMLEGLLERAKAGQITGAITVCLEFDGGAGFGYAGQYAHITMIGMMQKALTAVTLDSLGA